MDITDKTNIEKRYEELINNVIKYITTMKSKYGSDKISAFDLVYDYAFKNDIEVEELGDAIYDNEELKKLIECDLPKRKSNRVDDW